jgi:hypothetical protein
LIKGFEELENMLQAKVAPKGWAVVLVPIIELGKYKRSAAEEEGPW